MGTELFLAGQVALGGRVSGLQIGTDSKVPPASVPPASVPLWEALLEALLQVSGYLELPVAPGRALVLELHAQVVTEHEEVVES